jgi:hypothetical protein
MTPLEFKAKVEELGVFIVEKMTELEEDPKWGTSEEREELAQSLDEIVIHAQGMRDFLQEGL